MSTSTSIAITCLITLVLLNFILPQVLNEFEGKITGYTYQDAISDINPDVNFEKPDGFFETIISAFLPFINALWNWSIFFIQILFWNWNYNVYINLIMSFLKIALAVSLWEIYSQ